MLDAVLVALLASTGSTAVGCPVKGTNASCAEVGGCGHWCAQVCSCDTGCADHREGCCWDHASCGPPSPHPPHPPHPRPPPPPSPGGPKGGPEQYHLALGSKASGTSVIVDFATSPSWGEASVCEQSIAGAEGPWTGGTAGAARTYTDGGWDGILHRAELVGLPPNATFWYRCCKANATGIWNATSGCEAAAPPAEVRQARTPPVDGTLPVTVAAIADLGENCNRPDGGCGNATIAALGAGASVGEFAALIHAGDIAYTSGDQNIWDTYMREMDPTASAIPYQVCAGNHEHYYNFSGYRHRFSMGASGGGAINNLFHSFNVGGVHFAAFSSEHDYSAAAEQVRWLAADLAAVDRVVTPWVVVFAHRPLYCSTNDYFDCEQNGPNHLGPIIEPILESNRVDLYLAGHLHNYERTWPVGSNGTVVAKSYSGAKNTVHAVVGMAGCDEGLTDRWISPSPAWSAVRNATLGYAKLRFTSATEMTFEYVESDSSKLMDTFTLSRPVPRNNRRT